jgi:serine/threonine protein kinase
LAVYRIESLPGEGGMDAVYKATDIELNRTVALKLVHPELATKRETMDRFYNIQRASIASRPLPWTTGADSVADPTVRAPRGSR